MGMAQPGRGGGRGPGPNVEGDRWGKRALPPPPPGTGGPAMSNLPALHKTDNKFKVRHAVLLPLLVGVQSGLLFCPGCLCLHIGKLQSGIWS